MNEVLTAVKEYITPLSLLLITLAGIVENSKKITAKPISKVLCWFGCKLNTELTTQIKELRTQLDELREQQLLQEAYELNDFYNRHANGEVFTREQYELAIAMYHRHINKGANHVDKLHLKSLEVYYLETWG